MKLVINILIILMFSFISICFSSQIKSFLPELFSFCELPVNGENLNFKPVKRLETYVSDGRVAKSKKYSNLRGYRAPNPLDGFKPGVRLGDSYDVEITIYPILAIATDLSKINVSNTDHINKSITISLPTPEVSHAYYKKFKHKIKKRKPSFNKFGVPDHYELNRKAQDLLLSVKNNSRFAKKNGIFEKARKATEKIITDYAAEFGYSVKFI